ncbi:hypothetical protein IEO21_08724 [Rhodonia placenta]|uniref:FAD/NAD(P)-binding domain-containing protein n=1 Tax=Rhodonia placenta TaxID=104341 RepID=A0A8H7TYK2_9APHY|nr:hypothetical protein IEO21_08724 [Postia placenta]
MEPHDIAAAWLHGFALAAFRGDVAATVDTILPDGFLRDWLVFTWDIRSLEGHASISAYLVPTLVSTHLYNFKLDDRAGAAPETVLDVGVGAGFTFEMPHRRGRGYVRLFPSTSNITKEWKAMSLFLMVEDIKGHEELGPELGVYGGHTLSWAEVLAERRASIEKDPYVVILGAGQNGLNIAARFKQWNIPTLVVEKNHRVGDNWRQRYPTLSLHTTRQFCRFLYQPFPENWPTFSPRDKLADWMEQYAVSQDLVVWTDSEIKPGAQYDYTSGRWTVTISRNDSDIVLRPAHIVCAAGITGPPRMPHVSNRDVFRGEAIHAVAYQGGHPYVGKCTIVVGACQSAVDICQDLVFQGAASVTMVQRSSTCVVSIKTATDEIGAFYREDLPIDVCDLRFFSTPRNLVRRMLKASESLLWAREADLHAKLKKGGMKLNMGDGSGYLTLGFERLGGWDVGIADYIDSGRVKIKQGVEVKEYTHDGVVFSDGSAMPADLVIFATGYGDLRDRLRPIFGTDVIKQGGLVWGMDEEGETRGSYRPTGHPGVGTVTSWLHV